MLRRSTAVLSIGFLAACSAAAGVSSLGTGIKFILIPLAVLVGTLKHLEIGVRNKRKGKKSRDGGGCEGGKGGSSGGGGGGCGG